MAVRTPVTLSVLVLGEAASVVEAALDRGMDGPIEGTVEAVHDATAPAAALETAHPDCVVVGPSAGDVDTDETVAAVTAAAPDRPIVAIVDDANAAAALDAGVADYVPADVAADRPALLADRITRAVDGAIDSTLPGSPGWYDALLEQSVDALTVLDAEGTITYQNPSVERLLGYEPEALVGTDSLEYIHPEDREQVRATFERLFERGNRASEDLEFRFRHADGSWEWLESVVTTRTDPGIGGYVVNSRLVTERKEREQEVERYEALLSVLPDTIAITDLEGIHQDIYGFEGWSGYEPADLLGESIAMTTPEDSLEVAEEAISDLILDEDKDKTIFEMDLETKDGEQIPFENHVTPLPPDDDGEIPGMMNVLRNVSDRKEREHRLEEAETVFENVQDGVFLAELTEDDEFRFQRVNPAYREMAPLHEPDIVGKTPVEVAGPETGASVEARLRECVEGQATVEYERELSVDGESSYWHIRLAPVVEDGEAVAVVGAVRDVTERTERERELELKNRAMDQAPIGITVSAATEDGAELVYANEGYEVLTGYSPADLQGEDWWLDLFGEETDHEAIQALDASLDEADHGSTELQLYRKDGTPRWFQVSLSPLRGENGEVTHFLSFQQDITDIKEYETEIERRFDEFADLFAEDLGEPLEQARAALDRARTNDDEEALANADEWLARTDDLLTDLATVHSFTVPSRDHSESARAEAIDDV